MVNTEVWKGKRVLVTGHTGFKGGWLVLWLDMMGAEVHGLALEPDTTPSLFVSAEIEDCVHSNIVDVRDELAVRETIAQIQPEIVFHLAAQPLVRRSYDEPLGTFATNVMGTANLLEACRNVECLKSFVCVTTDKVYENREWVWPYRESDPLGGKDPYSASKAAAELVTLAYRRSFYEALDRPVLTARGGNVIGGGDWAEDRLVPDLIRATQNQQALEIRSPNSIRPWQHVLVLCHGYLTLAEQAMAGAIDGEGAWNFGPLSPDCVTVSNLLTQFSSAGMPCDLDIEPSDEKVESTMLSLDSSMARRDLGWQPALELPEAVAWTAQWYLAELDGKPMQSVTKAQIEAYASRVAA
jgi:CDP-glucose 4,6-dehydratase